MKTATRLFTLAALLAAGPALAADPKPKACQDTTAIDWFFPGDFEAARSAAEKSNRILLIKGIAFGVDAEGAKCATKGCW
jgi:hypothetical protein